MTSRAAAVILAAGSGTRLGAGVNKVLLPIDGISILARSVRTVLEVTGVHRVVLVVRPEDREDVSDAVAPHLGAHDLWVVDGGAQRQASQWQALPTHAADIEDGEIDVVAIHDAARPL
ncbi:MAG: 2-C-methyl-D-erythritol 4-phosphate cytidylyltransferase, partial [Marmoricola sp.]